MLDQLRKEINGIDRSLVELFCRRMNVAAAVAEYKRTNHLPVYDAAREAELLDRIASDAGCFADDARELYSTILMLSKRYQSRLLASDKPVISGKSGFRAGLIGERLGHSYSPQIHALLSDYEYRLIELRPDEVEAFLHGGEFDALNVTIPYKLTVMPYLDYISDEAKTLNAVNTIVRRDGKLYGYNTDGCGFTSMLRRSGIDIKGKKVLVLGSGGSSHTVSAVISREGGNVTVISRSGENNYTNLSRHFDADVIVNTTPVGMFPDIDAAPLELRSFSKLSGVFDLIYNPSRTKLLCGAEELSIPCLNGLTMLVCQAKRACELFLDVNIADSAAQSIIERLENDMRNIILIGMPGCGKSTVGASLAKRLGRSFIDTDAELEKQYGSISDLMESSGEAHFRELEHKVLSDACSRRGAVIATGGGIVTREDNYYPMHANGIILFLRRDIELLSTKGRPLSERYGVDALYRERLPLYERFADATVDAADNPNATVERIVSEVRF